METLIPIFLVFVRIGAVFIAAPFFGHQAVPVKLRILFAMLLAFAIVGLASETLVRDIDTGAGLLLAIVNEAATGLTIGFVAQFLFWTVQFAAEILGFQMGLSIAQAYNPIEGLASNPIGRFLSLGLLMVFILLEGPRQMIYALVYSFEIVPLAGGNIALSADLLVRWAGEMFSTGVTLASPFIASFLLIEFTLGIFARVLPQADLFSLGLPVKLLAGLALTWVLSESLFATFPGLIDRMVTQLGLAIQTIAGQ